MSAHQLINQFIPGCPVPKGSLDLKGRNIRNVAKVDDWVAAVALQVKGRAAPIVVGGKVAPAVAWTGPVYVVAEFVMPTASVIERGTGSADLDKLARAVGDALQNAGVFADDVQVVQWNTWKRVRREGEVAGVRLEVWALMSWP